MAMFYCGNSEKLAGGSAYEVLGDTLDLMCP
jgi:hypothetical protein